MCIENSNVVIIYLLINKTIVRHKRRNKNPHPIFSFFRKLFRFDEFFRIRTSTNCLISLLLFWHLTNIPTLSRLIFAYPFGCRYVKKKSSKNERHNQTTESSMVRQRFGHPPVFQRAQYTGRRSTYCWR